MRHPEVPEAHARDLPRARAADASLEHLVELGVTTVELLPGPRVRRRGLPRRRAGSPTTGATTRSGTSRPPRATPRRDDGRRARSTSSRRWSSRCTRRASRWSSTSSTTTPPRRDETGRRCRFRGLDDAGVLPPRRRRSRLVDTTGCGNSLNAPSPAAVRSSSTRCATGCRAATSTASASTSPRRSARPDGAFDPAAPFLAAVRGGPGAARGQAHLRALGRRREDSYALGRFPRRSGSGTAATATRCATSGAAPTARSAELATRRRRLDRPVRTAGRSADRLGQLRDRPTTASRCATSSATTRKHNEANGEDNADGTDDNRSLELRRGGPDRRPASHRAARRARPAAMLATLLAEPRACPCCSAATSWAAPRAATTTPTARTTRRAGSTGTRVDGALLEFTTRALALRRAHPALRGVVASTRGAPARSGTAPDGSPMGRRDWEDRGVRCVALRLHRRGDATTSCVLV